MSPILLLLAACAGGGSSPSEGPSDGRSAAPADHERKAAPADRKMPGEPEVRPASTVRVPLPPDEPGLADHYLVILASKLDPAEVTPAVEAVKAQAGIQASPRVMLSSRFKNLMPCYTIGIADGFADKKSAFALSKQLTAAGIDNYVKNAGAYVGPSPTLDSFCAGMAAPSADSEIARALRPVNGRWWMPTGEGIPENVRLKAPERMDDTYSAWIQGLGNPDQTPWRAVSVQGGEIKDCKVDQDAILTLGTPHFGVLQAEDKPTEPQCGTAERYAELDCPAADGPWIAVPATAKPVVYKAAEAPALVAAAEAELKKVDAWSSAGVVDGEDPPTRTVTVTRYEAGGTAYYLVQGDAAAGNSVCGGDEVQLRALYTAEGEALGRRLGSFQEAHFSIFLGVVDVEGDGAPELYWSSFPDQYTLARTNGDVVFQNDVGYCDCPC